MATVVEGRVRVSIPAGTSYRWIAERYDARAEAALREGDPARARDHRRAAATFRALAEKAGAPRG
jgi:hypothetical protein